MRSGRTYELRTLRTPDEFAVVVWINAEPVGITFAPTLEEVARAVGRAVGEHSVAQLFRAQRDRAGGLGHIALRR
jgi:hypothetical protein